MLYKQSRDECNYILELTDKSVSAIAFLTAGLREAFDRILVTGDFTTPTELDETFTLDTTKLRLAQVAGKIVG